MKDCNLEKREVVKHILNAQKKCKFNDLFTLKSSQILSIIPKLKAIYASILLFYNIFLNQNF